MSSSNNINKKMKNCAFAKTRVKRSNLTLDDSSIKNFLHAIMIIIIIIIVIVTIIIIIRCDKTTRVVKFLINVHFQPYTTARAVRALFTHAHTCTFTDICLRRVCIF